MSQGVRNREASLNITDCSATKSVYSTDHDQGMPSVFPACTTLDGALVYYCFLYAMNTAQQIHCPGDTVSVSCTTSSSLLQWRGSALTGQCNQNNIILGASSLTVENISDTFVCGDFTATLTNLTTLTIIGQNPIVLLVSSLAVTATSSLDGTTITCRDGVSNIENVQLTVPGMSVCHLV